MSGLEFTRYSRDLIRAAAGIDSLADLAAFRTAKGAAGTAKSVAPRDQGDLAGDIKVVRQESGRVAVETDLYYAAFQEFGTSQMAPNPFMSVAAEKWEPELVSDVVRIRNKVVKELS